MKFGKFHALLSSIAILASPFAMADEARYIASDDKQFVFDITTGLVWKRCAVGTVFDNGVCKQVPAVFFYSKALAYLKAEMPGWRIPTVKEFSSLVECKSRASGIRLTQMNSAANGMQYSSYYTLWHDPDTGLYRYKAGGSDNFETAGFYNKPLACGAVEGAKVKEMTLYKPEGNISSQAFPVAAYVGSYGNTGNEIWTADSFRKRQGSFYTLNRMYGFVYFDDRSSSNDRTWGDQQVLLPVARLSDLKNSIGFSKMEPGSVADTAAKLSATSLSWKHDGVTSPASIGLTLDGPTPSLEQQLVMMTQNLVMQESENLPALPSLPERSSFVTRVSNKEKGEFETTDAYEERIKRASAQALQQDEERYQVAVAAFQFQVKQREQRQAQIQREQANPSFYQRKLGEAWQQLVRVSLGSPILRNIRYDADQQIFLATLHSSIGGFSQEIRAAVPLSQAERLKPDLVSGKVAPSVEFAFPSMTVTWNLIENSALRAQKFATATTVAQLERAIAEYPNSAEAKAAHQKMFTLSLTSKELAATINRYRDWPEASAANTKLRAMQIQEFKDARAINSVEAYDKFFENFGTPDLAKVLEQAKAAQAAAQTQVAKRNRENQEKQLRACERFYNGKAVGFAPAGFIYAGAVLEAVVLGKSGTNVTLKITDMHFDNYGKIFELPCSSEQIR